MHAEFGRHLRAEGAVQSQQGEHHNTHQQVEPLHLTAHVAAPGEALKATPHRHRRDDRQQQHAAHTVHEHGGHAAQAEGARHPRQWHGGEHFVEAGRHREVGDQTAGQQVVPAHIVETTAGDRQGQEAEHPLLEWIEGTHHIKGDRNHEQPDGEVHQIRVNRQGIGQPIGSQLTGDLLDRRGLRRIGQSEGQARNHQISPARAAATTFTVCRP